MKERTDRTRVPVLKLRVDLCDYESTIGRILELGREGVGGYVCVANVHVAIEAENDPRFAELVNDADLVLPDGTPLVWMQRLQGNEDATQVRGPSLMPMLIKRAEAEKLSVGFLGGRPEVLERILARATMESTGLNIGYKNSPPFRDLTEEDNAEIANAINSAAVQILFVGLGCPKQERWMAANRQRINAVMIGVGAAFDLYAGNIREAPSVVSKLGLEWMFRLIQEPRRLFSRYLLVNPRFVWLATRQLMRRS
ncbi:MAG TPA: WecB/TagA/CpsF family glycosyltransferase [Pyrinomonadaceae bacterium]|nr:WecB/TagA/CpsF family glycosyltransferase [Pyrinomonadaceae bacterium]